MADKKLTYEAVSTSEYKVILNANENNLEMPKEIQEEILKELSKVEYNRYPENDSTNLRKIYADLIGVKESNIIVGHGSDEMLGLLISLKILKGNRVLTLAPDFSMYDFYTYLNEGEIYRFNTERDGSFDIDEFIEYAKQIKPEIIMFSNPNNPTGHALENEDFIKICKAFKDIIVVCDEAYVEFFKSSMVKYINDLDNLIVTRTVSKAWGLAGIRVGFLVANEKLASKLAESKVPYNVNRLSQCVAETVLKHKELETLYVDTIINERERVYNSIKDLEFLEVYPSKSNFLYCRSLEKDAIFEAFEKNKVLIRNYSDDTFRITIGTKEENDLVIEILSNIF